MPLGHIQRAALANLGGGVRLPGGRRCVPTPHLFPHTYYGDRLLFEPCIAFLVILVVIVFTVTLHCAFDQEEFTGVVGCAGWLLTALILGGLLVGPRLGKGAKDEEPTSVACECPSVAVCRD